MTDRFAPHVRELASSARFGKFVSVGAVGAVFDTATLFVLVEFGGVLPELANAMSIEAAILLMFVVNDHWTFAGEGARGLRPIARRLLRSHAVRAGGVTVQFVLFVAVFRGLHTPLSFASYDLWLVVAKVVGIGGGVLVNYVFESLFTWRVHREDHG